MPHSSGPAVRRRKKRFERHTVAPSDMSQLLASSSAEAGCSLVPEPLLLFSGKSACEDPKTGLAAFGPYSKTDATRRSVVRVGVVGPADAVDRALVLLQRISEPISQSESLDVMLHPSFPGLNELDPFQIELVTQKVWCRTLSPADVVIIEGNPDFTARIRLLLEAVKAEILALQKLDVPPDIVIVAMSQRLEELCRVGIARYDVEQQAEDSEEDELTDILEETTADDSDETTEEVTDEQQEDEQARSFRRGLKAACLNILPTQLLWHRTLAGSKGVQDLPSRAWNLAVAFLYKAGIVPWRLAEVIDGSCFVGISFFHPNQAKSNTLRTSVAQAFTDRGEGFVLQGDEFEWSSQDRTERSPHLSRDAARELLLRVLKVYEDQIKGPASRVVVHKTSRYTEDERLGFQDALGNIKQYALVTICRRGIFCLRPGNKPTLRGTLVEFGDKKGLIYTAGFTPFLRCYPGFRVPQPLEITENWGSLLFREVAEDIIRLTKLNWNTAAFNCVDPITLAFSKKVGEILKMANTKEPAMHYRYYM